MLAIQLDGTLKMSFFKTLRESPNEHFYQLNMSIMYHFGHFSGRPNIRKWAKNAKTQIQICFSVNTKVSALSCS